MTPVWKVILFALCIQLVAGIDCDVEWKVGERNITRLLETICARNTSNISTEQFVVCVAGAEFPYADKVIIPDCLPPRVLFTPSDQNTRPRFSTTFSVKRYKPSHSITTFQYIDFGSFRLYSPFISGSSGTLVIKNTTFKNFDCSDFASVTMEDSTVTGLFESGETQPWFTVLYAINVTNSRLKDFKLEARGRNATIDFSNLIVRSSGNFLVGSSSVLAAANVRISGCVFYNYGVRVSSDRFKELTLSPSLVIESTQFLEQDRAPVIRLSDDTGQPGRITLRMSKNTFRWSENTKCDYGVVYYLGGGFGNRLEFNYDQNDVSCSATCPPGRRNIGNLLYCLPCPDKECKSYCDGGRCLLCNAGFELNATSDCSQCPLYHANSGYWGKCSACPSPGATDTYRTKCVRCEAGSFTNMTNGLCQLCPSGLYQDQVGSTSCKICPPGFGPGYNDGATTCESCQIGTSFDGDKRGTCEFCSKLGTWAPTVNSSRCSYCPAGTFGVKHEEYHVWCNPCPAYTYQDSTGELTCKDCPANQTSEVGSAKCTSCPPGTLPAIVNLSNRTRLTCQDCLPGTYHNLTTASCSVCPVGTSSGRRALNCTPCERNYYQPAEASAFCLLCASGIVSSDRTKCSPCDFFSAGVACSGISTSGLVILCTLLLSVLIVFLFLVIFIKLRASLQDQQSTRYGSEFHSDSQALLSRV